MKVYSRMRTTLAVEEHLDLDREKNQKLKYQEHRIEFSISKLCTKIQTLY